MDDNWNNNCLEDGGIRCLDHYQDNWKWVKRGTSETSTTTSASEADSEPTRLRDSSRSMSDSTNDELIGVPVEIYRNRPIVQDMYGQVRQPSPEETEPQKANGHHQSDNGTKSSSSSSASSSSQDQNKNRQSNKTEKQLSRENDDKFTHYVFHLIPAFEVPDLSRLYQWWTELKNSVDLTTITNTLETKLTENQLHICQLMFRAFIKWDQIQDEQGAVGVAPEIMVDARNHYFEFFQEIKYMSSRLLSEVSYLNFNHWQNNAQKDEII